MVFAEIFDRQCLLWSNNAQSVGCNREAYVIVVRSMTILASRRSTRRQGLRSRGRRYLNLHSTTVAISFQCTYLSIVFTSLRSVLGIAPRHIVCTQLWRAPSLLSSCIALGRDSYPTRPTSGKRLASQRILTPPLATSCLVLESNRHTYGFLCSLAHAGL